MNILRTALLKGSQSRWLERQVTGRRFARRAVRRFMPGEEVEAALAAAQELQRSGIATILTRLGENVTDLEEAQAVTRHYVAALREIDRRSLPTHLSIKPTQLGLDISFDACEEELRRLTQCAHEAGNVVWIDMESSAYVDATLALYRRVRSDHANVGLCLQSYLYRTEEDLRALGSLSPIIRVVKGAYREPETVAFSKKHDVDESFFTLATRLLTDGGGGPPHGIATHDPRLIQRITAYADSHRVPHDRYEFQMLFGIQRSAQRRLVAEGHRVRVLISYGNAWFPWYMRRLAERPANLWFVLRSVVRE